MTEAFTAASVLCSLLCPAAVAVLSKGRNCCCWGAQPKLGLGREDIWHSAPLLLLPSSSSFPVTILNEFFFCLHAEEQLMCEMLISAGGKHITGCYLSMSPHTHCSHRPHLVASISELIQIHHRNETGLQVSFHGTFLILLAQTHSQALLAVFMAGLSRAALHTENKAESPILPLHFSLCVSCTCIQSPLPTF